MSSFPFSNVSAPCLHVFLSASLANLLSSVYMGVSHWLPGPARTATTIMSLVGSTSLLGPASAPQADLGPASLLFMPPCFHCVNLAAASPAAQSSCSPTTTSSPVQLTSSGSRRQVFLQCGDSAAIFSLASYWLPRIFSLWSTWARH